MIVIIRPGSLKPDKILKRRFDFMRIDFLNNMHMLVRTIVQKESSELNNFSKESIFVQRVSFLWCFLQI